MCVSIPLIVWVAYIACYFKDNTMRFTQKQWAVRLAPFSPVPLSGVNIFLMHVAIALAESRVCYCFFILFTLRLVREVTGVMTQIFATTLMQLSDSQAKPLAQMRQEGSKNEIIYHWRKMLQSVKEAKTKSSKFLHLNISVFDVFLIFWYISLFRRAFICEHSTFRFAFCSSLRAVTSPFPHSSALSSILFIGSVKWHTAICQTTSAMLRG